MNLPWSMDLRVCVVMLGVVVRNEGHSDIYLRNWP